MERRINKDIGEKGINKKEKLYEANKYAECPQDSRVESTQALEALQKI